MAAPQEPISALDFDDGDPAAFYLPDSRADMEALADVTLVAGGARLPSHSQVLSLHSGVLRGMFADLRGQRGQQDTVGAKRKAEDQDEGEGLVLEAPFQGCDLFTAALFLRCCYASATLSPANLAAVQASLPALLRLAHKLDAPQILRGVEQHLQGEIKGAQPRQLMPWLELADACQLPELRLHCVARLARCLAARASSLAAGLIDAELLRGCSRDALLQLIGMLLGGGGAQLAGRIPNARLLAPALQQARNPVDIEWTLERFSEFVGRPSGDSITSPELQAAGRPWTFTVTTRPGKIDVAVACKQASVALKCVVLAVNQATDDPIVDLVRVTWQTSTLVAWSASFTHSALRSRPGFLEGDRLVLRARVEVVL